MASFIRSFFHLAIITLLASVIQAKVQYPTDGLCVQNNQPCELKGNIAIKNPGLIGTFAAFNAEECAQRCYDRSTPCKTFSIVPSADNVHPGTCKLYKKPNTTTGVQNNSSTRAFYDADCLNVKGTDDTPVEDGNFEAPSKAASDAWSGEDYEGQGDESGSYYTHYTYRNSHYEATDNHVGKLGGFHYQYSHSYSGGAGIEQLVTTCPEYVYSFTFLEGRPFDCYYDRTTGDREFEVIVNDVIVYSSSVKSCTLQRRGPFYVRTSTRNTHIIFSVPSRYGGKFPLSTSFTDQGYMHEDIDNVVLKAVYRGTLPVGTTVIDV